MTKRLVADVVITEQGERRAKADEYDDAVYWDDDREEANGLSEGEVSIIPR